MDRVDTVVIGGGIVGLAVAYQISQRRGDVYVLERNLAPGQETSSHNSGVIHSGIYYPKDSLKARLCVRGNELTYSLCERYGVEHKRTGKLIVAAGEEEMHALEALKRNGDANGVSGLEIIDSADITRMEPHVRAVAAIYSPSTGVVDQAGLLSLYRALAEKNGAHVVLQTDVQSIKRLATGYELSGSSARSFFALEADTVINCAGLGADKIAEAAGLDVKRLGYRIHYCKGDYFAVSGSPIVRMPVYPVPEKYGLGIHVTPDTSGMVRLGPNAYYVHDIGFSCESDPADFRRDVSRFLPSIAERELHYDYSGIRPKLQGPGESFKDFVIRHEDDRGFHGFINLIGIESPGLTAAPAIAEFVRNICEEIWS